MGFPYNEVVHIVQKYISARKMCFGHPKESMRCLQTSTGSVHSIPHTRAAWDGLRNEPQPTATNLRHQPPLEPIFQEPCSYSSVFFSLQPAKIHICWMEHLELDYEADIWWFCSTHGYYKTTKYELHSPTLSAPSRSHIFPRYRSGIRFL